MEGALRELRECGFVYCTPTGRLKLTQAGINWCLTGCKFDHEPDAFDLEVASLARELFSKSVPVGVSSGGRDRFLM